jgi:hypothetical protein
MNLRNKYAVHTVRTLLGLLMAVMGVMGLYFVVSGNVPEVPGATDATRLAEQAFAQSGVIQAAKVVEIVAGLLLLFNFRPALGTLLLAPVVVGIIVYDLLLWSHMPSAIIPAWFAVFATAYLGYVYWDKYAPLFQK